MKYRLILAAVAVFALSACSTIQELYTDVPKEVAAAQILYATIEDSAQIYAALPSCGTNAPKLCRDPGVTAKMLTADNAAYFALKAAFTAESQDALDAAETAVTAFENIVNGLPTAGLTVSPTTNSATATN